MSENQDAENSQAQLSPEREEKVRRLARRQDLVFTVVVVVLAIGLFFLFGGKF